MRLDADERRHAPGFAIREGADLEPGPGEVVVDLVAAALNRQP